ncbi:MAG: glycosyltransferase, partial [Streptosporangiales bacterium]|nr:glycosyltransferase [Streptosporangiales bacterium]
MALGVGVTALVLWLRMVLGAGTTLPVWLFVGLTLGVNVFLWGTAGALRLIDDGVRSAVRRRALGRSRPALPPPPPKMTLASLVQDQLAHPDSPSPNEVTAPQRAVAVADPEPYRITPSDIAILMCARDEELMIGAAIRSAARLVPASNIYVASDASIDATAEIARRAGANVLEIYPNKGKAGAIQATLEHFALTDTYEGVLVLDADSELDERYLTGAVQLFSDPGIVAVAGYAETQWRPREQSLTGQFITAYRDRLYLLLQVLSRFGQTWRH